MFWPSKSVRVGALRVIGLGFALTTALALCSSPSHAQEVTPTSIANACGFEQWDKVVALNYTFNVQLPGGNEISRKWTWDVKAGQVSVETTQNGEPLERTIQPRKITENSSDEDVQVHKWFINDKYWLLFQFQIVWDKAVQITNHGQSDLPIGDGQATKLTVKYPAEAGGYTPGDAYDIFVDDENMIIEWAYRPGGQEEPRIVNTWESHEKFGPLVISTEHKNADGSFHLWFSDVQVRTK